MAKNDVVLRKNSDLAQISDTNTRELARIIFNLRQRFYDNTNYSNLVLSAKYFSTKKMQRRPTIISSQLKEEFLKDIAALSGINDLMLFQVNSWKKIHEMVTQKSDGGLIVTAETGMGKTEAVIPPVVYESLKAGEIAVLIFPRRALLRDQLKRILGYERSISSLKARIGVEPELRISIQMGGVAEKLYWTTYNNVPNVNEIKDNHYKFENDFFSVSRINDDYDEINLLDVKCPICDESLSSRFKFKKLSSGYGREERNKQANAFRSAGKNNYTWSCPNHPDIAYKISFSREDHFEMKPNIIFTTMDSFESIFLDPGFGKYVIDKCKFLVLDEAHVYNGIYGTHAAAIIDEFTKLASKRIIKIGLSATLDKSIEFFSKLTNLDILKIVNITPDKQDYTQDVNSPDKKFIYLKAKFHRINLYSMVSQAMIQATLLFAGTMSNQNRQLLAFMDSLDAVTRMKVQSEDAYNSLHLQNLRLDDLSNKTSFFDARTCKGYNPPSCSNGCYVYENGECWLIARDKYLRSSPQSIEIVASSSANAPTISQLSNASLIFSTSELELGMDLPGINYLVQYKAPFTRTSFIQRVGRAGRSIGEEPLIILILGENTNDYIYYRKGSDILTESLATPLNVNNEMVSSTHAFLVKTSNEVISEIVSDLRQIQPYVKEIADTWKVIYHKYGEAFSIEMDNLNFSNIITADAWDKLTKYRNEMHNIIDRKIDDEKERLGKLTGDSNKDPREEILSIYDEIRSLVMKLNIDTEGLRKTLEKFLGEFGVAKESRDFRTLETDINHEISSITRGLDEDNLSILKPLSNLHERIKELIISSESSSDDIRSIFYRIQFYLQLKDSVAKSSLIEIIKGTQRANYFLETSNNFFFVSSMAPFPNALFEFSRYVLVTKKRSTTEIDTISINNAMDKYFPFRLNVNPGQTIVNVVLPSVRENGDKGRKEFIVEDFLDYIELRDFEGMTYSFPRILTYDRLETEKINGLVNYCDRCYRFYSFQLHTCKICKNNLKPVRVYSASNVDSKIRTDSWNKATRRISYSESARMKDILTSVSLTISPALYIKGKLVPISKNARHETLYASKPYGYELKTKALKIEISPESIELMKNAYKSKFPNVSHVANESNILEKAVHTVAHLWLIVCSEISETSDSAYGYDWSITEDGVEIMIAEQQEGGVGYLETFLDSVSNHTRKVYETIERIVNCEEHEAVIADRTSKKHLQYDIYEWVIQHKSASTHLSNRQTIINDYAKENHEDTDNIQDNYPTCIDGCTNCLAITECHNGKEEQLDSVSLTMAKAYLDSIVKAVNNEEDLADLIGEGYKIIRDLFVEEGRFLLIDL